MTIGKKFLLGMGLSAFTLALFNPMMLRTILQEILQAVARVILEFWNALAASGLLELALTLGVIYFGFKIFLGRKRKK